jgi:hypothetical protein
LLLLLLASCGKMSSEITSLLKDSPYRSYTIDVSEEHESSTLRRRKPDSQPPPPPSTRAIDDLYTTSYTLETSMPFHLPHTGSLCTAIP